MYLVTRTHTFAKLFFVITFSGLCMYLVLAFYTFHTAYSSLYRVRKIQDLAQEHPGLHIREQRTQLLKYILLWTNDGSNYIGEGSNPLTKRNCSVKHCLFTSNRQLLGGDYEGFHAIVFRHMDIVKWQVKTRPLRRAANQKYIFYSMESSATKPVCNVNADKFFNWTWSYKLYSDVFSPFIEVLDLNNSIVAPKPDVQWLNPMIFEDKLHYSTRIKAVAWIVHKCNTQSNRLSYIKQLKEILERHSMMVDIFGNCGFKPCPNNTREGCIKLIKGKYYFYLAFEDSIAEDYVTDEVLTAIEADAVPIVMGAADYSKFLPDNSYINARQNSPEELASQIAYLSRNLPAYFNLHRWRNLYTVKRNTDDGVCQLCAMLNNPAQFEESTTYYEFRKWWFQGALRDRCMPKGENDWLLKTERLKSYPFN